MYRSRIEKFSGTYIAAMALILAGLFFATIVNSQYLISFAVIRYFTYLIPPLVGFIWLTSPKYHDRDNSSYNLELIALWCSLLIPALIGYPASLSYIVFMGFGFTIFLFPIRVPVVLMTRLFWAFSAVQVILFAISGATLRSADVDSFSSGSEAATHTLPGIFGLFLGLFLALKKPKYVIFCILMIFLSGKRSVLLASLIGVAGFCIDCYVLKYSHRSEYRSTSVSIRVFLILIGFIIAINLPSLYDYLSLRYGLNVAVLTSGRYSGQQIAYSSFWTGSFPQIAFGQGLGSADGYALIGFDGLASLIHCDYLRVLLDFGLVPGFVFCFAYLGIIGRGPLGSYFMFFSFQLWMTENNLINAAVPVLIYLCRQCANEADRSRKIRIFNNLADSSKVNYLASSQKK